MNIMIASGRIGKDIELKSIPSTGKSVLENTIAVYDGKHNGESKTVWINFTAWEKTAELIQTHFKKGDMIGLVGKYQSQSFDKKEGGKGYKNFLLVSSIEFYPNKKADNVPSGVQSPEVDNQPNPFDDSMPF